jgi:BirA family transcriptional regulator, biotin operon repressor / biotin---[acetyl-CoA-carboxylase] ligase
LYKIPAKTLFIGKNLIFVPECNSTNTLAQQLGQQPSVSDGTLVITDNQTAGRGQRGNSWEVEPGANFTFSLILKTGFLPAQDQFGLNMAISVGILDYLKSHLKSNVHIKWPNDILVENRKVCGILIENSIKGSLISHSVVGVGLNVNQIQFTHDRATSLKKETGKTFSLHDELENLLWCVEKFYMLLRQQNYTLLQEYYYQHLYGLNEERKFKSSGTEWTGTITGVDHAGRLKVQTTEGEKVFSFKEIEFVY